MNTFREDLADLAWWLRKKLVKLIAGKASFMVNCSTAAGTYIPPSDGKNRSAIIGCSFYLTDEYAAYRKGIHVELHTGPRVAE